MTGSNRFLIISNIIKHRVYIYIPNILSKSNHYITHDSKMYHISNYTPSVPQLGHTFLGARDPKGLAASRSICRKTWKLRPLKPCRDLWEIYGKSMGNLWNLWEIYGKSTGKHGFYRFLHLFTTILKAFLQIFGRIQDISDCKMAGQKVCYSNSTTVFQTTLGAKHIPSCRNQLLKATPP